MKPIQKLANITKFDFFRKPEIGKENILVIEGVLSDPLWQVQKETIDINNLTKKISVRIWVTRDPNLMAPQVVKKYVKKIKITFPQTGKWQIQVNDKNLETIIE